MISFDGRVALVTGASKGIGEATARKLGALGARVAVHTKVDREGAARVASSIGDGARVFLADLARWDAAKALAREIEDALGPIDVAILNHGIWKGASIEAMTEAEYDEMLDTNVKGMFALAGELAARMKARARGAMVLVSSTAGQRGEAEHSHYAATKGAIISLTKSLATELAPFGVRVNCVAPGWVGTPMTEATLADPIEGPKVLATIPLRRVGTPDEIASAIAFAASDAASFVVGEILNVNGGAVLCG